jgi:hemolysin activation/secretion protein
MRRKLLLYFFSLAATSLVAFPPPVPSAGVVEREIEREYEGIPLEPDKEVPAIQIDIPKEHLKIPRGKKVFVRQIEIRGNHSVPTVKIVSWISPYLDRELSIQDIYELCHLIDQRYAEEGYFLARAYPPPQTIANDALVIEVIEGKLGTVQVVGNKHYTTAFISSYFESLQDKPLQYNEFLRALMLLNENTDMMAGAVFEKGKEFGYADVILRVNDARPVHLYLNGNNYGRNLTTNVRAGGRLDWGNLITQGDTLSVAEVVGFPVKALYFTDVIYNVPLNRKGTSIEGAYLFSKFHIEELTRLHLKGRSDIATLKVNQALLRRRSLNLDFFTYFDYKQIQNFVLDHRTSFDKLRVLSLGTLLDYYIPCQSRDYLILRFAAGIPNFLGGLKAVDRTSSRIGGGGRFFILTADYDRIQHLPKDCFFYFHATGQLSPNKLTLPEQIYIGGVDTVRGFPWLSVLAIAAII